MSWHLRLVSLSSLSVSLSHTHKQSNTLLLQTGLLHNLVFSSFLSSRNSIPSNTHYWLCPLQMCLFSSCWIKHLCCFFYKKETISKNPSFLFLSFQVKHSQKTLATQRNVSPAQNAQVCSSWKRRALTPMTPRAHATMATIWTCCGSGASPAPCAPKAMACSTAAS